GRDRALPGLRGPAPLSSPLKNRRLPLLSSLAGGISRIPRRLPLGFEPRFLLQLCLPSALLRQSGLGTCGFLGGPLLGFPLFFRFLGCPALGRTSLACLGGGAAGGLTLGILGIFRRVAGAGPL